MRDEVNVFLVGLFFFVIKCVVFVVFVEVRGFKFSDFSVFWYWLRV